MKNSRVSLGFLVGNLIAVGFTLNVLPAAAIAKIGNSNRIQVRAENFLRSEKITQTCPRRSYSRISTRQIEQLLNCMGIRSRRDRRETRNAVYRIELGESDETLLILDDCTRQGCRDLVLLALFESDRSPSQSRIRQWNQSSNRRNARAYIDEYDNVILESAVSLDGRVDSEEIMEFIDSFQTSINRFRRYVGFR